jgi:hypothetical protein
MTDALPARRQSLNPSPNQLTGLKNHKSSNFRTPQTASPSAPTSSSGLASSQRSRFSRPDLTDARARVAHPFKGGGAIHANSPNTLRTPTTLRGRAGLFATNPPGRSPCTARFSFPPFTNIPRCSPGVGARFTRIRQILSEHPHPPCRLHSPANPPKTTEKESTIARETYGRREQLASAARQSAAHLAHATA